MSFMAGYLLGLGEGGNIQPLTITQNGTYNAADYGCDGFEPVVVNVPAPEPVIQSKTITKNGTYTAPEGVDGYSPVIVKNPYETLYKLEHEGGEDIDTKIPDSDGNNIIINGEEIGEEDMNDLLNAAIFGGGSLDVAVSDGSNLVKMKCELVYSTADGIEYVDMRVTLTNMKTGQTFVSPQSLPFLKWRADQYSYKTGQVVVRSDSMGFSATFTLTTSSVTKDVGDLRIPALSNIGITNFSTRNDKYYILGGV